MRAQAQTWKASSEDDLEKIARDILQTCENRRIFALNGELGAGKTTFVKAICRVLGVKDLAKSPTFAIVNEYDSPVGTIYHFDCYRLKDEWEALDLGFEEYLESGAFVFIEWPERVEALLPDETVELSINIAEDGTRIFRLTS